MISRKRFHLIVLLGLLLIILPGLACTSRPARTRPPAEGPLAAGQASPEMPRTPQQGALPAQGQTIRFAHTSVEDGLSQNAVLAICQDRRGFMWFGTEDGLNKYDGYQFTVYKHDPDDPTTLSDNFVSTIYQDRNGELWLGTRSGLERFVPPTGSKQTPSQDGGPGPASGTFVHYTHDPDDPQTLGGTWVVAIYEDREGTLWVGTDDGGLDQLDRESGTFTHYRHDPLDPASLSDNGVRAIYQDQGGVLWVGTSGGLNQLDRTSGTFTHYQHDPEDPQSLSDDRVSAILEDRQGMLWIGTEGGGLERFDRTSQAFVHHRHDPEDVEGVRGSLSHNRVRAILEDSAGRLWVGTQNGLDLYDRERDQFVHYRHNASDPYSLSSNAVWSIYQDRSGVLWFGTYGGGLDKYNRTTDQFALYQHNPGLQADAVDSRSLSDNMVWAIHEDRSGMLWIGTFNGGLNRLDRQSGTFTVYRHDPADPASLSSDDVRAILEDRTATLWVGTQNGLDQYDPQTEMFLHYRHDPGDPRSLSDNRVTVLHEDRLGNLWVGTRTGGLNRLDRATGDFDRYRHDPDDPSSLSNDRVWAIYGDTSGALWVGTLGGISLWDPDSDRFTRYLHDADDPGSLSNDAVFSFYQDPSGTMWIGTWGGGLNRFDRATQTFAHYTEKDGLANDVIYGIEADAEGFLWLSTNKGLSRFDPRSETFHNYDVSDGLQNNEFNVGAHFGSQSGELFFGGIQGFNAFHPDQVRDNPYPPPIVITAFSKFNEVVRRDLFPSEHIRLSHKDNLISFEFAALDYVSPEKNRYAYMLEGQDQDWIDAGTRRYASYTNLKGGDYVFRVKGSNNDGVWNQEGVALSLTVTPPFWERWWFRGIVLLLVVGGTVGGYRLRVSSIKAQSRELETQVRERTREIEQRTQELEALNIENARLFEAEQRRAEQFRVIGEVGRSITSILAVDELLKQMVRLIKEALDYYLVGIALIEEDKLVFKAGSGAIWETPGFEPPRIQVGQEGITGWVAQSGEPLLVTDVSQEPRYYGLPQASEIQSELAVPLKTKERVIGVLHAQSDRLDAFDESDLVVLQSLAHQAAIAIDNARLFAEAEQRMQELEALYRADEEMLRYLKLDRVLQALVDVAVEILRADKGSLLVWDAERERLIVKAARGFRPETMAHMSFKRGEGSVGRVVASGQAILVEDTLKDLRVARRVTDPEGIRSFMHVPIKIGGQIFGVFNVDYAQPRAFGDDELRLFTALAQRAALVIEKAQLYEQAQELAVMEERQRLARDLHDAVTQTLFSASLIAEVLPRLWERNPDQGRRRLGEVRELTRGALAEMRTLLLELRPSTLIEAELGDLLRQLAEAVTGRARVPVAVEVEGTCALPPDVKVALYRVAQEALNNVAKHAGASQALVSLRCSPLSLTDRERSAPSPWEGEGERPAPSAGVPSVAKGPASAVEEPALSAVEGVRVELCIRDDGRGFELDSIPPDHLGVSIMRERAQAIGAELQIDSQVGQGTQVVVIWETDQRQRTKDEGQSPPFN